MTRWLEALAPREKLLVGAAAILLILVVFIQFVSMPLLRAHAQAVTQNEVAAQTLAQVSLAGPAINAKPSQVAEAPSADAFRQVIISTARNRGLAVSRIQSTPSGGVKIVMEEASPKAIFAWLAELEGTQEIRSDQLVMSGVGDGSGRVRASIDFGGGR